MKFSIAILASHQDEKIGVFTKALLSSMKFYMNDVTNADVSVIGSCRVSADFKLSTIKSEDVCSVKRFADKLPYWYIEQLSALYFAANSANEYSLILPVGAFAVAPVSVGTLIPRLKARTVWESRSYHPDWWLNAQKITRRKSASQYEGPTVLPGIMSRELASWTLDLIERETGRKPIELLTDMALSDIHWSAMSLYASAASERFGIFHHDSFASKSYPLMSQQVLWSSEQQSSFNPARGAIDDYGIFTYVNISEINEIEDVLDRLYACLQPRR